MIFWNQFRSKKAIHYNNQLDVRHKERWVADNGISVKSGSGSARKEFRLMQFSQQKKENQSRKDLRLRTCVVFKYYNVCLLLFLFSQLQ